MFNRQLRVTFFHYLIIALLTTVTIASATTKTSRAINFSVGTTLDWSDEQYKNSFVIDSTDDSIIVEQDNDKYYHATYNHNFTFDKKILKRWDNLFSINSHQVNLQGKTILRWLPFLKSDIDILLNKKIRQDYHDSSDHVAISLNSTVFKSLSEKIGKGGLKVDLELQKFRFDRSLYQSEYTLVMIPYIQLQSEDFTTHYYLSLPFSIENYFTTKNSNEYSIALQSEITLWKEKLSLYNTAQGRYQYYPNRKDIDSRIYAQHQCDFFTLWNTTFNFTKKIALESSLMGTVEFEHFTHYPISTLLNSTVDTTLTQTWSRNSHGFLETSVVVKPKSFFKSALFLQFDWRESSYLNTNAKNESSFSDSELLEKLNSDNSSTMYYAFEPGIKFYFEFLTYTTEIKTTIRREIITNDIFDTPSFTVIHPSLEFSAKWFSRIDFSFDINYYHQFADNNIDGSKKFSCSSMLRFTIL